MQNQEMRNQGYAAIGIIWGAAILLYFVFGEGPRGEGAYFTGQIVAIIFGILLLVVGLYTFFGSQYYEEDEHDNEEDRHELDE